MLRALDPRVHLRVAWIVALAFKVTVGAIHLLVIAALILYVWGFVRGRTRTTVGPGA